MLELNQAWLTGYLIQDPQIQNAGEYGDEKAIFWIKTIRPKDKSCLTQEQLIAEETRVRLLMSEDE